MHRKFIALIVCTAIAITGFSAAPARAGETEKLLGGLAAIAIIGAAIHRHEKRKKRRAAEVARQTPYQEQHSIRPLPPHIARYDLPQRCLKQMDGYTGNRKLYGPRCLNRHYAYADSLPQACRISFWNGHRNRVAYEPRCLRHHGYRTARR